MNRQPIGAYEEGDAQHDDAVHGAVEDKYGQPQQPATASAATTGAQRIFKRIRIFLTSYNKDTV